MPDGQPFAKLLADLVKLDNDDDCCAVTSGWGSRESDKANRVANRDLEIGRTKRLLEGDGQRHEYEYE